MKDDESPVTAADLAAERIISDGLRRAFPGTGIVSEESAGSTEASLAETEEFFLVDPLDGTKEFIARNGEFTVNIALVRNGIPVLGVVYAPALDLLYYASEGKGAYRREGRGEPVAVSCVEPRTPPRMVVSRSHLSDEERLYMKEKGVSEIRYAGSSLKGCLVADGESDLYFRAGDVMEWDIAAMHAVLLEAGGRIVFRRHSNPWYGNRGHRISGGFRAVGKRDIA